MFMSVAISISIMDCIKNFIEVEFKLRSVEDLVVHITGNYKTTGKRIGNIHIRQATRFDFICNALQSVKDDKKRPRNRWYQIQYRRGNGRLSRIAT